MRKQVWFQTNANGRKVAYRFSPQQMRSFRVSVTEAEMQVATGEATQACCNPMALCQHRKEQ